MPFKAKLNQDFYIKNDEIHLDSSYLNKNKKNFKKITGSRIASILNRNKYNSPLKTWMIMTNLYYEDMDPILSEAGKIIEPKLIKHVENLIGINYISYDPFKVKWDVFNDNPIFGGIPDGEPFNSSTNKFLYDENYPMLEIKTTSKDTLSYKTENFVLKMQKDTNGYPIIKKPNGKMEEWFSDSVDKNKMIIPIDYKLQLCLYMYLRNIKKGLFVVAFLESKDYVNPNLFDPLNSIIKFSSLELNKQSFSLVIDAATNWYNKHINSGISPKISLEDKRWLDKIMS